MKKRKIVIMIGSDSDLPQCVEGLKFLKQTYKDGKIFDVEVITASIHRNTDYVLEKLIKISELGDVDAIITGAGWANHLTGVVDAYLRYGIGDKKVCVIGVAFEDEENFTHSQAALLGISEVPGTQVVYRSPVKDRRDQRFFGEKGFLLACKFAVENDLPIIKQPNFRETKHRMLSEMKL